MTTKILKVGFDLDGVILYNPARVIRPIIAQVKKNFLQKKQLSFYYPKTKLEKYFWRVFHKSSIFIAPGFEEIINLTKNKKIQSYIVTARFNYLEQGFQQWLQKSQAKKYFHGCFHNVDDMQPHLFKEKMIKQLGLDIYVEDNWDIVQYLQKKFPQKKIYWIYNFCDRNNIYNNKFPNLKQVNKKIKSLI